MKNSILSALVILMLGAGCTTSNKKENMKTTQKERKPLTAQHYYSGFPLAHDTVYNLARFEHEGKEIQDLVKIPDPFGSE